MRPVTISDLFNCPWSILYISMGYEEVNLYIPIITIGQLSDWVINLVKTEILDYFERENRNTENRDRKRLATFHIEGKLRSCEKKCEQDPILYYLQNNLCNTAMIR